ncbi:FAD-containing subunit of NADH dehydrogenase [Xylaria sp. CBS 124048]|nr:FAD-containing subunit of NADH dehydrogenase [Xylaria sp. CBS 124048]
MPTQQQFEQPNYLPHPSTTSNMSKRIIIVGSGFSGFWAAVSARRLASISFEKGILGADRVDVVVVAPDANLVIRPRLYEPDPARMSVPVDDVYRACGVHFVHGIVDTIRTVDHEIEMIDHAGVRSIMTYDKLILAAGSRVVHPSITGLHDYTFTVDQLEDAVKLERHLQSLASKPASKARNTFVVCGGGFTGIEVATELPYRLRAILGQKADIRVVVVDREQDIGAALGPGPRPHVVEAFADLGIESILSTSVAGVDASGVILSSGERIETLTPIWTAGVRASPLTTQVPGEKDAFGRLRVDEDLRVSSDKDVLATGDVACALTDGEGGHYARMSCQHAIPLGKIAGHNAMADLLQIPAIPYSQPLYVICLDLGATGAFFGKGWDFDSKWAGPGVKSVKQFINGLVIYPPRANAGEAFAAAEPVADYSALQRIAKNAGIML